jgi:DNA polymerase III gamma/tau subunit
VLPTILSRCQRYDFRNIPTREIAGHLKDIVQREKVKADDDALLLVAKAGAGSMRDALSLLDRLLSIGEERLTVDSLEQLLGLPKSQLLFQLADAIGSGDTKAVLGQSDSIISGGLSPDSLVAALVDHLRNLLVLRACGGDTELVEVPGLSRGELQKQAAKFDPVALTQDIAVLEELRRHMRQSQGGRALLDATLVRMTLSDQFASISDLLGRLDGNGPGPASRPTASRPAGSGVAPRLPVQSPAQKKNDLTPEVPAVRTVAEAILPAYAAPVVEAQPVASVAVASAAPAVAPVQDFAVDEDDDDDLPRPGKVWDSGGPSLVELLKQRQQQSPPAATATAEAPAPPEAESPDSSSNVEPIARHDLPTIWKDLLADLSKRGPVLPSLLMHGRLAEVNGDNAIIRYGPEHETFVKMLDRNGKREQVRDALTNVMQRPIGVTFEVDPNAAPVEPPARPNTPAPPQQQQPPQARRPAPPPPPREPDPPAAPVQRVTPELVESIRSTQPLVKALMDELGAQVIKVE